MGMMMNEDIIFNLFIKDFPNQEHKYNELKLSISEILAVSLQAMQMRFPEYLYRVIPSVDTIYKEPKDINKNLVVEFKNFAVSFSESNNKSPLTFGRIKYYLDSFFFSLTQKGNLDYLYSDEYLLTVHATGRELKVSRPTIGNYVKSGQIEMLNTLKHNKIPRHSVEIWKDTDLLIKTRMLIELYSKRNNPLQQQLEDIQVRIKEFEDMYDNQPFEVVYKDVIEGNIPWDSVDSVTDYSEWETLIEDRDEIRGKLGIRG